MHRKTLKKTLGIIEQEDQKQQSPYQTILSLLNPNTSLTKQNSHSNILQELDNFHKYYNQRYEEYKENYQKIKKQNWDYAAKIIKFEQILENYQLMAHESKEQIIFLEEKLGQSTRQYQEKIGELTQIINGKDREIIQLRGQLVKDTKHEVTKKKVIKLRQKSIRMEQDEGNLETARSHRQLNNLKNQIQQYALQTSQLSRQNEILRKKVKHLEADRKYQDQRLKNATLSLQLDLKIKNEQIERLNHQIQIYEKKFHEVIQTFRLNSIQNSDKQTLNIADFEKEHYQSRFQDNWRGIDVGEKITEEKQCEKTHRKLELDLARSERTKIKTHKRHGSSNLQENRQQQNQHIQKQELNLKIKVFKFSKNKKYI